MRWANKEEMRVEYVQMRNASIINLDLFYHIYIEKCNNNCLDFHNFASFFPVYLQKTQYSLIQELDLYFNLVTVSSLKTGEVLKVI